MTLRSYFIENTFHHELAHNNLVVKRIFEITKTKVLRDNLPLIFWSSYNTHNLLLYNSHLYYALIRTHVHSNIDSTTYKYS